MPANERVHAGVLKLYGDGSYLGKYSGDIVTSAVLIISIVSIVSYLDVLNRLKSLKNDFPRIRCDPSIVPFAGVIAAPEGESQAAYAADNFEQCTQTVLQDVAAKAFNPAEMLMSVLVDTFGSLVGSVAGVRTFFDYLRTEMGSVFELIFGIVANALAPVVGLFQVVKDITSRLVATLTITLYGFMGVSLGVQSVFNIIIDAVIGIMVLMVGTMVALFLIAWIPVIGQVAMSVALALGAVIALLLIPFAVLMVIMMALFNALGKEAPQIPSYCFHPQTQIGLADGTQVNMQDIVVGDKLDGGSTVEGTLILSNCDADGRARESLYEFLDTGTLVSGSHLVYDSGLQTFISVEQAWFSNAWGANGVSPHKVNIRKSPVEPKVLVCLITSNHIVKIGKHIFHDWEDRN